VRLEIFGAMLNQGSMVLASFDVVLDEIVEDFMIIIPCQL
jgi:hypothetical protein